MYAKHVWYWNPGMLFQVFNITIQFYIKWFYPENYKKDSREVTLKQVVNFLISGQDCSSLTMKVFHWAVHLSEWVSSESWRSRCHGTKATLMAARYYLSDDCRVSPCSAAYQDLYAKCVKSSGAESQDNADNNGICSLNRICKKV